MWSSVSSRMIYKVAILAAIWSPGTPPQWDRSAYYGKSAEEIVFMGRQGWYKWLDSQNKIGDLSMYRLISFGDALKYLNHKIIRGIKDRNRQNWFYRIETESSQLAKCIRNSFQFLSRGGDVWKIESAFDRIDIQQAIRDTLLGVPGKRKSKNHTLSSQVVRLVSEFREAEKGNELIYYDDEKAMQKLRKTRSEFLKSTRTVQQTLSRAKTKDRIFIDHALGELIYMRID